MKKSNNKDSFEFQNDTLSKVGERIKRMRKSKKMTQAKLAGENITRNMLSRIENGAALPSLGTLVYIALKLGVPSACLLDDNAFTDYMRTNAICKARENMKTGNYAKAREIILDADILKDDECILIIIECNLKLAEKLISEHSYFDAFELLQSAAKLCDKTVYSTAGTGYIASLYRALASKTLPLKKEDSNDAFPADFDKYTDMYIYLRLIDMFDRTDIVKAINLASLCELHDKTLSLHMAAKLDMAKGRYNDATSKLKSIEISEKYTPSTSGGLLLWRILTDLEECAKAEGDYVSAYGYREEKTKLFTQMSGIKL